MTTDDFLLDQVERSQRDQTRRRRDERSRRRQLYAFGGLALVLSIAVAAPSLVSHSSIGRSLLIQNLAEYGFDSQVDAVRIGWLTPLRISGLVVHGRAGSEVTVDQLDMDITVGDLMGTIKNDLGQITLRGVSVVCAVDDGRCSLEDDLQVLLQPSSEAGSTSAMLKLQDIAVTVTDTVTGQQWQVAQSSAEMELAADRQRASFAGVLTEPGGSGGSLQGSLEWRTVADAGEEMKQGGVRDWRLELASESLPLSVISLVRRRFPEMSTTIPEKLHGDATGGLLIFGEEGGTTEMAVRQLKVRNLTASSAGSRVWNNGLATLDGNLLLVGKRVIGRGLRATTDFASATIDGAFSRTFSLVGANDNPIRWLEAIEGTATVEIDLAAFDRSLPGVLPLRDEAQILSGRAVARVDSTPSGAQRRSQLAIRSEAIRARSRGGVVVIEPLELAATVSRDGGRLRAERFEWQSAFGSAIGQGDLRSGSADFEIDFGRLTAMLRPIVQISETSLAGAARGKVQWNASADRVWRLSGNGKASNLLITLAGGQSLKRPLIEGEIEAVGRWGGQSLEELSQVAVTLTSSGLDLRAELAEPVRNPSASTPMPMHLEGRGRVETLADTAGPWLPKQLHDASGGFDLTARAEVSSRSTRLTSVALELTEPRFAYASRYFSQPEVKVHFVGDYLWPADQLQARSLTVAGDAFSMAAKGEAAAGQVDLEVKWRAKLERIQGSVRKGLASRPSPVRQVGYQPGAAVQTSDWLVMGDCQGAFRLRTRESLLDVDVQATGADLAVVQPPQASAGFQTVGPMPRPSAVDRSPRDPRAGRVVWSEPNLKLDGLLRYDHRTGGVIAQAVQVAGDWFATTLSGNAIWNPTAAEVQLDGPARLKMDEVAHRLSDLAGIQIRATGIQESPLRIRVVREPSGNIGLSVQGNLGWEASEVGGVTLGPASIPVRLTETSVEVTPSLVSVGQGQLRLAGKVHYRPGPLWMQLEPGVLAKSIQLTPEMTDRWLKYLAPLAADAARIDGTIGAEIDDGVIVFDRPELCRVTGRLQVAGIEMTAGPMSNQILGGVEQLRSLARGQLNPLAPSAGRTLVTMPVQTVEFAVDRGVVTHDRLFFEVDRAQVVTSGRVSLDGRLDMIAQVPLDARWLGSDLQALAGQPVTLPISGTLSRPSLDPSGVQQVAAQLAGQAAQSVIESSIQKQINRGIEKLFGR